MKVSPNDIVVEIGPGKGVLTSLLLPLVKHLYAVEIDERAVEYLNQLFNRHKKLTIIHNDILNVDLQSIANEHHAQLRIIGNIPYYITTPILFRLFDQRPAISDIQMMMQKEVARRLVAKPSTKDYGILAVVTQFYGTPELLFSVSPNAFYPKPNVTSAIMRLTLNKETGCSPDEEKMFRRIVRATFGKRRKMLRSSLKSSRISDDIINSLTFDIQKRPEELTPDDFLSLIRELRQHDAIMSELNNNIDELE